MVFLRDKEEEREMGFNGVEIKDMDLVVVKKGGREIRQELVAIDKFLIKGLVREDISLG